MLFSGTCFGGSVTRLPSLPPPAPLPSLPAAFSRRTALFGAVVSTGALAGAGARSVPAPKSGESSTDSMPALYAEARALRDAMDRATSDAELDRIGDCLTDLEKRATVAHVTTPAGAVAALEWVRWECDALEVDRGDRFVIGMLDHALGLLRTIGVAS